MPATQTRYVSTRPRQTAQTMLPRLRKHDSSFRTRWIALIFGGAVACLIGPVLFGTLMWMRQHNARHRGEDHSWLWHVGAVAAWFLPIMFLIEWVTRGKLLENTVEEVSDMGRYVGGRMVAGAVLAEICLWGPRMVTGGVRQNIGLSRHRKADRTLAAAMLAELINRGESLPIGDLYALAGGRDDAFSDALAYLMFHDLVDTSKTGDRAWLTSDGKRALGLN